MTPEQARQLLENTSPAPWVIDTQTDCTKATEFWITDRYDKQIAEQETLARNFDETESDFTLMAAAPDMAAMIANMTTEYAVQVRRSGEWQWSREEDDFRWQSLSVQMVRADRDHPREETRIVCRYATTPQPLEGEEQ